MFVKFSQVSVWRNWNRQKHISSDCKPARNTDTQTRQATTPLHTDAWKNYCLRDHGIEPCYVLPCTLASLVIASRYTILYSLTTTHYLLTRYCVGRYIGLASGWAANSLVDYTILVCMSERTFYLGAIKTPNCIFYTQLRKPLPSCYSDIIER